MAKETLEKTMIQESKEDAEVLIVEAMRKVPEDRKGEVLRIVEGFALGATLQEGQKVG